MNQNQINKIKSLKGKISDTEIRREIRKFGYKKTAANNWFNKIFNSENVPVDLYADNPPDENNKVFESKDPSIRTLTDLIRVCEIDTSVWECVRFTGNSYGDNFQAKGEFKKKVEEKSFQNILELFIKESSKHAPKKFSYTAPTSQRDCSYILNIQDLHFSKLAWDKETSHDYDISIAKKVFKDAVQDLMRKAPRNRIEEVVIICGSDFFQCDQEGTTTAGTFVDTDSRLAKSFEEGVKLLTETIEELSQSHRVRVICYPGNHDATISMYAGYYISAWFKNNINVVVDNSPKTRKYYGYGKNLIAFSHGNEEKLKDLPLIIMRENMQTVSRYKYIECLTGHRHMDSLTEQNGIKIRTAPSLSATDSWHAKKGYVGNIRTSQGLLYNKETGIEAIYYSNPVE